MDKREQIARMAQTKEDEMLLARVYERMTNAAARSTRPQRAFCPNGSRCLPPSCCAGRTSGFTAGRHG